MRFFNLNTFKEYSIIFWIVVITFLSFSTYSIYERSKIDNANQIKSTIKNIYLKKVINEITKNLEPRYTTFNYISKAGDTHQNIINKLNIKNAEKKKLLDVILKEKSLKVLKINQKFTFKFDELLENKSYRIQN